MKQFVLDYLSNECSKADHVIRCSRDSRDADMLIQLASGKTIAVYIINRAIRVPEIRERLESNTARKLHTLFIVDGRMMPAHNAEVEPPYWMSALHSLHLGRIYAYWCDGRKVTIRPVHIEWKWGDTPRMVEYGPAVDMQQMRAQTTQCASKHITGVYAVSDFGEGAFWKKRDPDAGQQHKYSWRQWSYARPKAAGASQEQRDDYDPYEEFYRHYGSVGDPDDYQRYRTRQQQRRQYNGRTQTVEPLYQHYSTLGLTSAASFDEVKQAYRRKARENHPDLHPEEKEKYTARMAAINAAFEAISKRMK